MPTITIRATNSQGLDDWTLDYDVIDGVIRVRASNSEGSDDWTLPYTIQGGTPPPPGAGPAIALVGQDTAGGTIIGGGQSWVTIDGREVTVIGDAVQSHAPCPNPATHCAATMAQGSSWVTIDGIPICRAGDAATCGHPATGSSFVDST